MKELNITSNQELDRELKTSNYILLKAYTTWCGPCKMLAKEFTKVCNEINSDQLTLASCDVDLCSEIKQRFNVNSVPKMILLRNEKIINTVKGFIVKEKIINFIKENTNLDLS